MEIIFDVIGNTLIVEFFGELDHHAAEKTRVKIDTAMDNYMTKNLVMDFSKVSFMDSSGIGMVLGRYRKMGENSCNMAIVGCSKTIRNILNMAGVFSIIDYYGTREEAIEGFDRKEVS
ncbi:MAG: anti-sigma F factor antagonist [Firmicutes bacterium]|nr:anti-sigma F factor antagonist [Bacillota bacterium]